jgi:hypothetical protein
MWSISPSLFGRCGADLGHGSLSDGQAATMLAAGPIRFLAISTYSAETSIPMNRLPFLTVIFPVVPLPENGSKTKSPTLLQDRM